MRNHELTAQSPVTSSPASFSTETRAVYAGRYEMRRLGVHAPPIDLSTTYPLLALDAAGESLQQLAEGGRPAHGEPVYARLFNPTVDRFESALAELEGASSSVAFASGMAALTAVLLAARQLRQGQGHVVAVRPLYGGSDHLLASGLLGLEVSWTKADSVRQALRPDTVLVVLETPANPTLELFDIASVIEQAGDVPVLVDSTFATPVLQRPIEHGAALVLHSATKFLGGHGDAMGGVVAARDERWARALRQVRVATGGLLHPLAAFLLHRGLPTLPLRVRAAQATASELATLLAEHPDVTRVFYPGLSGGDPHALIGRQMTGPGSLLAFEVRGGYQAAASMLREVRLATPAVSLGSVDSLIQHPAALTHRVVPEAARRSSGISPAMLRLSVGLEGVADLWNDLRSALETAHAAIDGAPPCLEQQRELVLAGG